MSEKLYQLEVDWENAEHAEDFGEDRIQELMDIAKHLQLHIEWMKTKPRKEDALKIKNFREALIKIRNFSNDYTTENNFEDVEPELIANEVFEVANNAINENV